MIPDFRDYTDTNCGLQCIMAPGNSVSEYSVFPTTFTKKDKGHPRRGHENQQVGVEEYLYSFFNLGARYGWVVNITLRPL
jgi:hypothetical protein